MHIAQLAASKPATMQAADCYATQLALRLSGKALVAAEVDSGHLSEQDL